MTWLLLIYSVPAEPSRTRAAIWREIKKAGAVYLRDGVCALPEQESTLATFRAIADKVAELGGDAALAQAVQLDEVKSRSILDQGRQARAAEYTDLKREIDGFVGHIRRERAHREFTFSELEQLEGDVAKLKRWLQQIAERDFTRSDAVGEIQQLFNECETELRSYLEEAYKHEGAVS